MSIDAPLDLAALPPGFAARVNWSSAAETSLIELKELLAAANKEANLVGASTLESFWTRHVIDSAQLRWVSPQTRIWADIGSGAGFPGLVLGILLKDAPGAHVHLIESMSKRCRFLRTVVERLNLPCTVHEARAEALDLNVEMVTARACAPLVRLLGFVQPYFRLGAGGLFLKSLGVEEEIAAARRVWRFDVEIRESLSDRRGRVLSIRKLARAAKS